jgi:preprotein translocase subunit YajC
MFHAILAQAEGKPPGGGGLFGDPNTFFLWMIALMVLFWLVVLGPMSRRQRREQQQMLASIKRGTRVVTSAGIIGTVVNVKEGDEEVTLRSEDSRLKVLRSSIVRVLGSDEGEAGK